MNNAEMLMKEIIKDTMIVVQALDANKIEIALSVLKRRQEKIESFSVLDKAEKPKDALMPLLEEYREKNDICIEKMKLRKDELEDQLFEVKKQKQTVYKTNKVSQQYKLAEAFLVGNRFDSNKKLRRP